MAPSLLYKLTVAIIAEKKPDLPLTNSVLKSTPFQQISRLITEDGSAANLLTKGSQ
jgi:hypothetical protein